MLKDTYVIVTLPESDGGELSAGPDPDAVPEIDKDVLSVSQVEKLEQEPRKRAVPLMPWTLIEPTATEEADIAAEGTVTWGVEAVGATSSSFSGSGITVAVLDTGIDLSHPAFEGMTLVTKNFTEGNDEDINGHGTHCAATIFGQDVDGLRIGIARKIERALIGKVLGKGSSTESVFEAISWAVSEGAHVISMSLGINFRKYVANLMKYDGLDQEPATSRGLEAYRKNVTVFSEISRTIFEARDRGNGIVFVAASGNESRRPRYEIAASPPAAVTDIIAVGALGRGEAGYTIADFANNHVDFAAPGVDVISARVGGGLVSKSGTSMATPHVAGIAALYAQRQYEKFGQVNSGLLAAELRANCSMDLLDPDHRVFDSVGAGIVQAPSD